MSSPFETVLDGDQEMSFGDPTPDTPAETTTPSLDQLNGNVAMQNQNSAFNVQPQQSQQAPPKVESDPSPFGGFKNSSQSNYSPPAKNKYNIIDLFWLLNAKLRNNAKLESNEATMVTVGFNADYLNMRIALLRLDSDCLSDSYVIGGAGNANVLAMANMFPESCIELLSLRNTEVMYMPKERMIKKDTNFTPNRSGFQWSKNALTIYIEDGRSKTHYYMTIVEHQLNSFIKACEFMYNGEAFKLAMEAQFRR
jgi:hypothetical protein